MGTEEDPVLQRGTQVGRRLLCPGGQVLELCGILGKGAMGTVFKCVELDPETEKPKAGTPYYAAKVVDVRALNLSSNFEREKEKLQREIVILSSLQHEGVVELSAVIDGKSEIILIMEYIGGGELFYKVVDRGCLTEDQARYVFLQIARVVKYMHSRGVLHRDIKLENVLIADEPKDGFYIIKIADFGLSKIIGYSQARSYVGTPQYWAPEVITACHTGRSYGKEVDIWSLGCLLYVLLGGAYPFDGKSYSSVESQVLHGSFVFTSKFDKVSEKAKSLIRNMLKVNVSDRLSLEDVLADPWLAHFDYPDTVPPLPEFKAKPEKQVFVSVGPTLFGKNPVANPCNGKVQQRQDSEMSMDLPESLSSSPSSVEADVRMSGPFEELDSCDGDRDAPPPVHPHHHHYREVSFDERQPHQIEKVSNTVLANRNPPSATLGDGDEFVVPKRRDPAKKGPMKNCAGNGGGPPSICKELMVVQLFDFMELLRLQCSVFYTFYLAHLSFRHQPELSSVLRGAANEARELYCLSSSRINSFGVTCHLVICLLPDLNFAIETECLISATFVLENISHWLSEMKNETQRLKTMYLDYTKKAFQILDQIQDFKAHHDKNVSSLMTATIVEHQRNIKQLTSMKALGNIEETGTLNDQTVVPPVCMPHISPMSSPERSIVVPHASPPLSGSDTTAGGKSAVSIYQDFEMYHPPLVHPHHTITPEQQPEEDETTTSSLPKEDQTGTLVVGSSLMNVEAVRAAIFRQLQNTVLSNLDVVDNTSSPNNVNEELLQQQSDIDSQPASAERRSRANRCHRVVEDLMDFLFLSSNLEYDVARYMHTSDAKRKRSDAAYLWQQSGNQDGDTTSVVVHDCYTGLSPEERALAPPEPSSSATSASLETTMEVYGGGLKKRDYFATLKDQLHTTETLVHALDKLRRVDDILATCAAFWDKFDCTLEMMVKMKPTEAHLKLAVSSAEFASRFALRLNEYKLFWEALYVMCKQYVRESDLQLKAMQSFVKDIAKIADNIDSLQALQVGILNSPVENAAS